MYSGRDDALQIATCQRLSEYVEAGAKLGFGIVPMLLARGVFEAIALHHQLQDSLCNRKQAMHFIAVR